MKMGRFDPSALRFVILVPVLARLHHIARHIGIDSVTDCVRLAESLSLLDSDPSAHADLKSVTSVYKNCARMSPFLLAI